LKKADAELESQKEKQERSFSYLKAIESAVFIPISSIGFEITHFNKDRKDPCFIYKNSYFFDLNSNCFHPPCANLNV
jgi:hypothetical protein